MSTAVTPNPASTHPSNWLPLLARAAARLSQGEHSLRFIDDLFDDLAPSMGLDAYLYYQAEPDGRSLALLAYRGIDEAQAEQHDLLDTELVTRESFCVWPVEHPYPAGGSRLPELSASLNLTAGVHVPLMAAGKCLGTLLVGGRRDAFSGDEVVLLQSISDLVASTLDRGRLRYQLHTEHARFQSLLDHLPAAVLLAEASGRIVMGNPQAERMLGLPAAEPGDMSVTVDLPLVQALYGEEAQAIDYLLHRDDGTQTWLHANGSPIRDPQGHVIGNLITCYDINERVRVQEALVQADRSKDKFLAFLGHELRNPLSAISYAVSLLELDTASDDGRQSLELIRRQLGHISRLIEDLMDLARVKQGEIGIQKQVVDLNEVAGRAVEATGSLFQERNQTLDVRLAQAPLMLRADPVRLEQVIVNLLNNAAKYTESGGRIWLHVERSGDQACLQVRDNGIGMTPETLSRVFDLYAQDSAARDRSEGGLGIGLALVEALVRLHQGSVTAHSEGQGRGSEFTVRLPLFRSGEPGRPQDSA